MPAPIDISEERGVRYLHFGSSWIQGAIRIARPWSLELEYTRCMMLALLFRTAAKWPRNVLAIGLGAASVPKFVHRQCPRARVSVVEIEPRVIAAARQFFRLPEDDPPRFVVHEGDGDDYIGNVDAKCDLLFVDGFDARGHAGSLDTDRFYGRARTALTARGVMVVNLLGRSRGYRASVERIACAFDDRVAALHCESGNVIVFAAVGERIERSFGELRAAAAQLRADSGLNLLPAIARLARACKGQGDRLVL